MFKVFITQGGATSVPCIDGEDVSSQFISLLIQQIHLAHVYEAPVVCWALACRIQIHYEEMIHQKEFCKALKKELCGRKREKKGKTNNSKEDLLLFLAK